MDTRLNRSDWIVITIIYTITIIFNSIDYYKEGNELIEYLVDFPVSVITSICVFLLFMYWLIPNFLINKTRYIPFVILGLIILSFFGVIDYVAAFWSGNGEWNKFPKWYNLLIKGVYKSSDNVGLIFGIILTKKFYQGQAQLFNVQKQQKENELKLLRSQIDPHFLFNNLNTLDALIDSDTEKAKEYINRLSLIYRYLIRTKDAEVMELSNEIEFAENYIFLIQTRFGTDYDFQIKRNAILTDKFIPTGALLVLLENVVKHNKVNTKKYITTSIEIGEDWLTVINAKSNNSSDHESFGTGLKNLRTRYKLLSDTNINIIDSEDEFEVTIPIIRLSNEF